MQIQQPNLATFTKADYKLLQQMSDNDDLIHNSLESCARGVVGLGIINGLTPNVSNYSNNNGLYIRNTSNAWLDARFTQPSATDIVVNFEANRYYKFLLHLDYVWAANGPSPITLSPPQAIATNGYTGRIEIRVRDLTHRHDILYWTNYLDPDYNMGGVNGAKYHIRSAPTYTTEVNIWQWASPSAEGSVPSSCHAMRVMPAKTSGSAVLRVQYRPMNAYGGIVPPKLMDCSGGQPMTALPTQYRNASTTYNTEGINQFNGYFAVEDCGIAEKPAGAQPGVVNDTSVSNLFEAYENHPYDDTNPGRP
jgi:hypothetical protein